MTELNPYTDTSYRRSLSIKMNSTSDTPDFIIRFDFWREKHSSITSFSSKNMLEDKKARRGVFRLVCILLVFLILERFTRVMLKRCYGNKNDRIGNVCVRTHLLLATCRSASKCIPANTVPLCTSKSLAFVALSFLHPSNGGE